MRTIVGYLIVFVGFIFLLSAGSAVDMPTGTALNVFQHSVIGILLEMFGLLLVHWERIDG